MDIRDNAVIVTGGTGNLGASIVAALAERGARVAIVDVRKPAAIPAGAIAYEADLADDLAVEQTLRAIIECQGKTSVLVNCAGLIHSEPLTSLTNRAQRRHDIKSWDAVIRSNLTATFVISAHVAEHMAAARSKGVIINFSSIAAIGNPGQTAYAAAKAGVEAMTRVWARELGPFGIRAVAIAPGFVDTASTRSAVPDSTLVDLKRRTPLLRLGQSRDITSAVCFAIENDFLTGATIAVNGGLVL